ncbi:MAG: hypothetical protein JW709_03765 [Sedimentisphaerales bacterium]|nr:hypothetical protein [Sedimentisphaerales bacterium]
MKKPVSIPLRAGRTLWLALGAGVIPALAALVAQYGFRQPLLPEWVLLAVEIAAAVMLLGGMLGTEVTRKTALPRRTAVFELILLGVLLVLLFFLVEYRRQVFHLFLLVLVAVRIGRLVVQTMAGGFAPTRMLLTSFISVILIGAMLLMLPASHPAGEEISFTDALFTSTSATCVTGLVVKDTGGDFSRWGQVIILSLIQLGGLGIMIFGALFALLTGARLSLRESSAMQDIGVQEAPGRMAQTVMFICLFTLTIEAIGAVSMVGMWQTDPQRGGQWFKSAFHAVSAFCNAGFSLQADNLEKYRFSARVYLVIAPLIIVGGLGFPVLRNLYDWAMYRFRFRRIPSRLRTQPVRLTLHTKIVLTTTGILLAAGWLVLVAVQLTRPDAGREGFTLSTLLDGWFNSVTARTAGFNTVDIAGRSAGGKLVLVLLMAIGGSPGSTAGGMKTITLAVLILSVMATLRRHLQVQAFRRSIPLMIIRQAAMVLILYGLGLWLITLLLTMTEHSLGADMLDLLFEAASALGTVGLSTGVTSGLTTAGKWVIMAAMLIGRLGPLSLLAALSAGSPPARYEYPSENLIVS